MHQESLLQPGTVERLRPLQQLGLIGVGAVSRRWQATCARTSYSSPKIFTGLSPSIRRRPSVFSA